MTNSPSSEELLQQIQIGLYVVTAEVFLYGAYAILFGFYLYILRTRGAANRRFLTVATISLFILCTAHCAFVLASVIFDNMALATAIYSPSGGEPLSGHSVEWNRAANAVYVTSNVLADSIFLFRCYAIWNFRRKIMIFPAFLIFGVAATGYTEIFLSFRDPSLSSSAGTSRESFIFFQSIGASIVATLVLMGLSGGRIWWLSRVARPVVGKQVTDKYCTVLSLILESGALYLAGAIAFLVVAQCIGARFTTAGAILGQLVGIAPTLIAVRVGLGHSVENVDSFVAAQMRADQSLLRFRMPAASRDSNGLAMVSSPSAGDDNHGRGEAV
ncbi:hypothetical protein B0H13DRAFT_2382011 [Mycena leptocephala]|nr:hypothetical protein B0H13DRAFT_2382011 [Mycena leptocephala]